MRRSKFFWLTVAATLTAAPLWAGSDIRASAISSWNWPPVIVASLALTAILYTAGTIRMVRRSANPKLHAPAVAFFVAGWLSLLIALDSPLHELGEQLFWVHMTQHEILMLISAPLFVLSRPLAPMLWGMPFTWRRPFGQAARAAVIRPSVAWCVHAIALWVWHVPALFDATLTNPWIHAAQHLSFFGSALLFWWSLFEARGHNYGAGVLYIFTTAIHTSILGALLTFAPSIWYSPYAATTAPWGLTPLEDQQLGGLIMWVPAGLVYVATGLALFARWLRESEQMVRVTQVSLLFLILGACASRSENAIGGDPANGAAAITHYGCGSCHTIRGISGANALVGPPLTGFASRTYVAGVLPNTPENVIRWIQDPKAIDDKTAMPKLGVNVKDATDIAAYLYEIR
jgi:putative membrane protein